MAYTKINRYLFFLVVASFFCSVSSAQGVKSPDSTELLIRKIRKEYNRINAGSSRMKVVKQDVPDESPESGELRKFYEKDTLRKAVKTLYFEMGKLVNEYYFKDGRLFFSYEANMRYDKPMSVEGSKVSKVEQSRFYFNGYNLVRWLDKRGKIVTDKKLHAAKEKKLLDEAKKFR